MNRRNTPDWPTRAAQIAATLTLVGGPIALHFAPVMRDWNVSVLPSIGIAAGSALVVGFFVLRLCEWIFHAHMDSVETKSRANFGTMLLTAGVLLVAVATFVTQWQKTIG